MGIYIFQGLPNLPSYPILYIVISFQFKNKWQQVAQFYFVDQVNFYTRTVGLGVND